MDILKKIITHKQLEVAKRKEMDPVEFLEDSALFDRDPISMVEHLRRQDQVGIIAEFKRLSPSKGKINTTASIEKTSIGYMQGGASGLSILTDEKFFGGTIHDLKEARKFNECPILRKDFIIDEYQLIEAKSFGADMILLIAAVLSGQEVKLLAKAASKLGLEVLLEVHEERELDKLCSEVEIVGVNNRNLKTFETDINISKELALKIPSDFLKTSESGIHDAETILELKDHGFEGFLIGERFMANAHPERACQEFITSVKSKLITHET